MTNLPVSLSGLCHIIYLKGIKMKISLKVVFDGASRLDAAPIMRLRSLRHGNHDSLVDHRCRVGLKLSGRNNRHGRLLSERAVSAQAVDQISDVEHGIAVTGFGIEEIEVADVMRILSVGLDPGRQ